MVVVGTGFRGLEPLETKLQNIEIKIKLIERENI